jgi:small subunit ribosomal protein S7
MAEGISKSHKWIVEAARKRGVGTMVRKLADEFLDILQKRGGALRKKEESFKMAMANRVFSTAR